MEWVLYKPNKRGTGAAAKFNLHKSGEFSFLKMAPQIAQMGSERMFAWDADDKTINVKMNVNDLSSMLAVLYNRLPDAKLYHQTDNENKVIEFVHSPERKGYSLRVSHKVQGNSEANSIFLGMSYAEAMVFKVYAENVIAKNLEKC